jgi:hypothetical protein
LFLLNKFNTEEGARLTARDLRKVYTHARGALAGAGTPR